MTIQEQNRQAVIDYILQGSRPVCSKLGVEVEHFVVTKDGDPVSYYAHDGAVGVQDVLEYLKQFYPEQMESEDGVLLGLASEDGSVTLEPAAQLEFSIAPFDEVADVVAAYQRFRDRVDPFLDAHGAMLAHGGYHPTRKAFGLTLIPKHRYGFMDAYFTEIGTHGHRMMRASASTQVSIDFYDEADAVRKMRMANALAPIFAAIADRALTYEGEPNTMPITRFHLWREVDTRRCGVIPGLFDEGYGIGDYVDWLFRTRPIFVTRPAADDPEGPVLRADGGKSAAELYADAPMAKDDITHLVSMFWPDVRLKRFVEIRPADSLPVEQMAGYTALVKGLFYDEASLAAIEKRLGVHGDVWPLVAADVDGAVADIRRKGFDGQVYGYTLESWIAFLFELAAAALTPSDQAYLPALQSYACDKHWSFDDQSCC